MRRAMVTCPKCGSESVEELGRLDGTGLIEYVCDNCDEYFESEVK